MKSLLIAACIGAAVQWVIDWVLPALDKDGPEPKGRIPTPEPVQQPKKAEPDGAGIVLVDSDVQVVRHDDVSFVERYLRHLVRDGVIDGFDMDKIGLYADDKLIEFLPGKILFMRDGQKYTYTMGHPDGKLPEELANLTTVIFCYSKHSTGGKLNLASPLDETK